MIETYKQQQIRQKNIEKNLVMNPNTTSCDKRTCFAKKIDVRSERLKIYIEYVMWLV
jgi:hypothetical protein